MSDFKINPKDPLTIAIGLILAAIAGFFVLKNTNTGQPTAPKSGCGCSG